MERIKMRIWYLARILVLTTLIIFAIGCGGGGNSTPPPSGGNNPPPPPPSSGAVSVSVDPNTTSVIITQTQQFKATVSNASDTTVTWSVNGVAGGDANVDRKSV